MAWSASDAMNVVRGKALQGFCLVPVPQFKHALSFMEYSADVRPSSSGWKVTYQGYVPTEQATKSF